SAGIAAPAYLEAAHAEEAFVADFRLPARGAQVEALAWRADGDVLVARETLTALGIIAPDEARVFLSRIEGLSYREDASEAAIIIACTAACFAAQAITRDAPRAELTPASPGGFFNYDLIASAAVEESVLAGAFELGLFNASGFGEQTFIAESQGGLTRLDTHWTFDQPDARVRHRIGDSFTRGGAGAAPVRFGGVQIARDFSLDPGYSPYPLPTFDGAAETPSTIDLYVDGALRMRERVDAGPFTITDAPIVAGAGLAQIVVRDALGRETISTQPFYTSPTLLRPGLSDFSLALGALRENYAQASFDYGRGFASAFYRRGITHQLTAEARLDAGADFSHAGFGVSWGHYALGQIDAGVAYTEADGEDGESIRIGWQRPGRGFSIGAEIEAASEDFQPLGAPRGEPPPSLRAAASLGRDLGGYGSFSLVGSLIDARDEADVQTLSANYQAPSLGFGALMLNAFYVDDGEEPFLAVGARFSLTLANHTNAGGGVEYADDRLSARLGARRAAPQDGGLGWRASASLGDIDRADAGLLYLGAYGEGALEASYGGDQFGARAQYAGGLAWVGGALHAGRTVRESFALVEVGAAHIGILRDRRRIGESDLRGRLMVVGLRAYERNRIGIALDEAPMGVEIVDDEIFVTPRARSGVLVRMPLRFGAAGEARVMDAAGAALPAGAMLVRASDGARFPVGGEGRVYLSGVDADDLLTLEGAQSCAVRITMQSLAEDAPLICRAAG
ncbi:MAG: fimbria/pilus outer membrane usher protein, partial [Hyphomonadaceae bacterium]